MTDGWICLHRGLLDWEWYDDHNATRLFIHCLLKANHKDNKWQGVVVKKGSFITSLDKLQIELKMTKQQIRTSLKKLESTKEITRKSTNKFTSITVDNWEKYQDKKQVSNKQITNEQQTNNIPITTNNNVNNDNNDNNISCAFEEWYDLYHRRVGKKNAQKAYKKAMEDIDHESLVRRTKEFANAVEGKEQRFIPHPSTWLNRGGWDDDFEGVRDSDKPKGGGANQRQSSASIAREAAAKLIAEEDMEEN